MIDDSSSEESFDQSINFFTRVKNNQKDLKNYYMQFTENEKVVFSEAAINKFWGRITEIITGPEYEYQYLKRIVQKTKDYYRKKELKEKAHQKKLMMKNFKSAFLLKHCCSQNSSPKK